MIKTANPRGLSLLVLMLSSLLFTSTGCRKEDPEPPPRPVPAGRFNILFTGSVLGEIEPCGCAGNPRGGLARRASRLNMVSAESETEEGREPHLLLDSGDKFFPMARLAIDPDSAASPRSQELLRKAGVMADALRLMGYDAITPGDADLIFGVAQYRQLAERAGAPVVSANLIDPVTEELLFRPFLIREQGPVKVAVVGVTGGMPPVQVDQSAEEEGEQQAAPRRRSPSRGRQNTRPITIPPEAGVKAGDAIEMVGRAVEQARSGGADVVVLLAHLAWDEARRLVEQEPGVDVAIVSHEPLFGASAELVGDGAVMVPGGYRGMHLGQMSILVAKGDMRLHDVDESRRLGLQLEQDRRRNQSYLNAIAQHGGNERVRARVEQFKEAATALQERIAQAEERKQELEHLDLTGMDTFSFTMLDLGRSVEPDSQILGITAAEEPTH